ncbi:unnamed protein product [Allacma fusca]|uniref:Uncharacterized protein n=1 Tax=Allacma fusca TaxID=39272 RepID=A0A8J2K1M5_9HEXA|nr:unnamed protein product [Allacma fusca]
MILRVIQRASEVGPVYNAGLCSNTSSLVHMAPTWHCIFVEALKTSSFNAFMCQIRVRFTDQLTHYQHVMYGCIYETIIN